MIQLGKLLDGRVLFYDEALYEFHIDGKVAQFTDVKTLDARAQIKWAALEQRDWFNKIDAAALAKCNVSALNNLSGPNACLSAEERVQLDAKKNDSVLAGKIVDADPALVQAVLFELEKQHSGAIGVEGAPPAAPHDVQLPEGMEAFGQLTRQPGRKMTLTERYLMHKILKEDDKRKAAREKHEAEDGVLVEGELDLVDAPFAEDEARPAKEKAPARKAPAATPMKKLQARLKAQTKADTSKQELGQGEGRRHTRAAFRRRRSTDVPGMNEAGVG